MLREAVYNLLLLTSPTGDQIWGCGRGKILIQRSQRKFVRHRGWGFAGLGCGPGIHGGEKSAGARAGAWSGVTDEARRVDRLCHISLVAGDNTGRPVCLHSFGGPALMQSSPRWVAVRCLWRRLLSCACLPFLWVFRRARLCCGPGPGFVVGFSLFSWFFYFAFLPPLAAVLSDDNTILIIKMR